VFLRAAGSSHKSFESFGANPFFNEQIIEGKTPRVILLSRNGDLGFWENQEDGAHNHRDWVVSDLLPSLQKKFNALSCRQHCHVMGLSIGGFGALKFSCLSNSVFLRVDAISTPVTEEEKKAK
jgi:S-formylglutathione hydrolase FrmB